MDRRFYIKAALGAAAMTSVAGQARAKPAAAGGKGPIVLYCDLEVDPAREQEMLKHFHTKFKPAGAKFKGFIDLKILKLRTHIQGYELPPAVNYRFQLTYENEELRQIWIASPTHAALWPGIENTLTNKNFQVLLFDSV
ncbi:MAG: hypothetical protein JWP92_263 [Caulobacter sp.]|jgi:hypothetical protein|nr:hypothetical protein [Caulobacter sp.]